MLMAKVLTSIWWWMPITCTWRRPNPGGRGTYCGYEKNLSSMRDGKRQKTTSFRHVLLCCYCRYILEVFEHDKFRPGTASLWLQCCRELVLTYVQEARVDVSMVLPVVSVATLVTVAPFWSFDPLVLENLVNILRRTFDENSGGHKWQTNGEQMANTSQNGQQIHRCHRCHRSIPEATITQLLPREQHLSKWPQWLPIQFSWSVWRRPKSSPF